MAERKKRKKNVELFEYEDPLSLPYLTKHGLLGFAKEEKKPMTRNTPRRRKQQKQQKQQSFKKGGLVKKSIDGIARKGKTKGKNR